MKKLLVLVIVLLAVALCVFAKRGTGSKIRPELTVSLAPTLLKPGGWGVLTIAQIVKGGTKEGVELKEGGLDQRALFAKKMESSGWVDAEQKWTHRVQVYLIKPMDEKPLELTATDFRNLGEGLKSGPLRLSFEK